MEAASEGASTRSVSSSIELEDQNDNLSDMMSANVSGRGSPNVSCRNSPLSQADEAEEEIPRAGTLENDVEREDEAMEEGTAVLPTNNNNHLNPQTLIT